MTAAPNGNGTQSGAGDGGQGGATPPATPPAATGGEFDPSALTKDQINQILEKNPHMWQADRIAELREKAKKYDDAETARQQAEQDKLAEEGKFKELSEKQKAEVEQLRTQLKNETINRALIAKLAPEGVVDLDAALALIDRSGISLDDNNAVTGLDEAVEALKTGKSYLFGGTSTSVGSPTNPGNGTQQGGPAKFKRSQLRDSAFYAEHRAEILEAQKNGLIEDDVTPQ